MTCVRSQLLYNIQAWELSEEELKKNGSHMEWVPKEDDSRGLQAEECSRSDKEKAVTAEP